MNIKNLMQHKGYCGSVYFDHENMILYGKVEFVRASITYEARDAKGIKNTFEESVNDYLEICKENNIKPEKPFKGTFNVRIGEALHRKVALAAMKKSVNLNTFIKDCLSGVIKSNQEYCSIDETAKTTLSKPKKASSESIRLRNRRHIKIRKGKLAGKK